MPEDVAPRTFRLGGTRDTSRETSVGNTTPTDSTRGRRAAPTTPKSQRPAAAKGDVDRAVALLDTMYELIGDGMELFALEDTRAKWETAVTKLRRTNRDSLSASPKLAKQIAELGEGGGATTFFIAHAVAFATIVPTARREFQANALARPARHAADTPPDGVDWDDLARAAQQTPGGFPTGDYNVGEFIPGLGNG